MGKAAIPLLVLSILFLFPLATRPDAPPGGGFADSPHDFSRLGATPRVGACTFCHTPHKGYNTRLLWNHTLPNANYTWGDYTQTLGGTPLPTIRADWNGPTKYCLSCHDGSVAIGDIAWFDRRSWTGANALDDRRHGSDQFNIADFLDRMMGGNHPVAAPYPYQQTRNTYNGVTTGANVKVGDFNPNPTSLNIRLFNDNGGNVTAGVVAGKTGIECTSCHGVHNERGVVLEDPLLRGTRGDNQADYICNKCHNK